MFNPAQRLMPGTELKDGWVVSEFIQPKEGDTGGNFSERYIVKKGEQEAFLKAMDFHRAFQPDVDTMKVLNALSSEYLFERELLEICKGKKLSHVAHIIDSGSVYIGKEASYDTMVEYLIFELAEGDVRQSIEIGNEHQVSAMMHALHNISLGLWQLHKQSAAHQDIKPSNALVFGDGKTKITDLGRASRKDVPTHLDKYSFAGDPAYAPPELCYQYTHPDWTARRLGTDLYMLGSMIAYFFSGVSMSALLQKEIPPEFIFGKANYEEALPHLQRAFGIAVDKLNGDMPDFIAKDLTLILKQLCDPDLSKRGHPKSLFHKHESQFSLERYVGQFATLAKRADLKLAGKI